MLILLEFWNTISPWVEIGGLLLSIITFFVTLSVNKKINNAVDKYKIGNDYNQLEGQINALKKLLKLNTDYETTKQQVDELITKISVTYRDALNFKIKFVCFKIKFFKLRRNGSVNPLLTNLEELRAEIERLSK